jgi:hypothetical protein
MAIGVSALSRWPQNEARPCSKPARPSVRQPWRACLLQHRLVAALAEHLQRAQAQVFELAFEAAAEICS